MSFATTTELLPHQIEAVNKLLPIRVGALFAGMGTGKSRAAIELVFRRLDKIDKAIWFCPVSVKDTIRYQIKEHTTSPDSDIYVFNDRTTKDNLPSAFWYIIGIESMSDSPRIIQAVNKLVTERTFCIVDESSYIKGHNALRTERITKICERAKYRLILTGTPMSQGVVDLYAQMRFLSPKILGYNSFYSFAANHLEYSDLYPGMIVRAHNTRLLAAKIQPYVYQVEKEECLTLPPKLYDYRIFSMTPDQYETYEEVKDKILDEMALTVDPSLSSIAIFRLFSSLQQVTCGFWNERLDEVKPGKKQKDKRFRFRELDCRRVDTLMDTINDIPKDSKIVIFCKFQYDIDCISAALEKAYGKDSYAVFCGKISESRRVEQVRRFRNEARFFVINQASGGHGLTLNEASYVIFYNNAFKYSEREQAEDRCHRIGQDKTVTYIDITCRDSIDVRIMDSLHNKGDVIADFKHEVQKVKKERVKKIHDELLGKEHLKELIKAL